MADNQGSMTYPRTGTTNRPGQGSSGGAAGVMDRAQNAVSEAVDTAKEWASGAVDSAKHMASNVADKAQEMGSRVASGTGDACDVAWDTARNAEQSLETFIRRHPLQTLMFAFGAGCLVGLALRRD